MCLKLRSRDGAKEGEGEIIGGDKVKSLEGPSVGRIVSVHIEVGKNQARSSDGERNERENSTGVCR